MAGERTLGDYVSLQRGKTYKGSLVGKPGPVLLGLGSIEPGGGFRADKFKTYGGDCPASLTLYPGDMYASLKGATKDGSMIGSVARVPRSIEKGRLTQDTVKLQFHSADELLQRHVYWILRTPQCRSYFAGCATGSAQVGLSRENFLAYPIPPRSAFRDSLTALFVAIDDKIEVNRRMNATLESMARALFQSWFVDFDPVRAKMEGRQPEGMDAELAALFPDSFVRQDNSHLPTDWTYTTIDKVCEINGWSLCRSDDLTALEYVEISEVSRGYISTIATYARGEEPSRARRRLRHGDTVLSTVRPDRGSYFLAITPPINRVVSTGFAVLTPTTVPWSFLHCATTRQEVFDHLGQMADGGAYPAVRPEIIGAMQFALPNDSTILSRFHSLCAPVIERAETNRCESSKLTKLRDSLLPNLLSGELGVEHAEKRVGEAT